MLFSLYNKLNIQDHSLSLGFVNKLIILRKVRCVLFISKVVKWCFYYNVVAISIPIPFTRKSVRVSAIFSASSKHRDPAPTL